MINNWSLVRLIIDHCSPESRNLERYIGPIRDVSALKAGLEVTGLLSALHSTRDNQMQFLAGLYDQLILDIVRIEKFQELLVENEGIKEKTA